MPDTASPERPCAESFVSRWGETGHAVGDTYEGSWMVYDWNRDSTSPTGYTLVLVTESLRMILDRVVPG